MKKPTLTLIVSLLFPVSYLLAQATFDCRYESSLGGVTQTAVLCSPAHVISGVRTTSFGSGDNDFMLTKTDTTGALLWTKNIGTSADENLTDMVMLPSGQQIAIAGISPATFPSLQTFTLIDTSASIILNKAYYSPSSNGVAIRHIYAVPSGGFLLSGVVFANLLLVKLDAAGNVSWSKIYDTGLLPAPFFSGASVLELPDNNIVAVTSLSGGSLTSGEILLMITDSSGNFISANRYSSSVELEVNDIQPVSGGSDFLLSGTAFSSRQALMKINSSGVIQWSKFYEAGGLPFVKGIKILEMPDQKIATLAGPGNGGFEVSVFDSTGDVIWNQVSFSLSEQGVGILQEPSGNLIVSGLGITPVTFHNDLIITRLRADGTRCNNPGSPGLFASSYTVNTTALTMTESNLPLVDTVLTFSVQNQSLTRTQLCTNTTGIEEPEALNLFSVSPNPAASILNVNLNKFSTEENELALQDLSGRVLQSAFVPGGASHYSMDVSRIASGIYLLSLKNPHHRAITKVAVGN